MLGFDVVCVLAALTWVYLLAGHGGFWLTSQRLPQRVPSAARWPEVVAVVPARDEAGILPLTLPALLAQDYPGAFRVVLVDDCSTDGTAGLARQLADDRLTVLEGKPTPDGWAGKVWAMRQGLDHAGTPEYLLFTDADIAWAPGALRDLVAAALADDRDLTSQMALLRADSGWERLVVPAFVYFFAQLYPFRWVNSPRRRTAAAAGGCMLVRRAALEQAGGLAQIKGALIDDVALGALLKRHRHRTWLGLTTDVVSVRPYDTLDSLWRMIARSAYTQLRCNPLLLAGTLLGLLFTYLLPPAAAIAGLVCGDAVAGTAGFAAWAIMTVTFIPMLRLYRLSVLRAVTLPVIALVYTAMTGDSARRYYRGRGGEWKGRLRLG